MTPALRVLHVVRPAAGGIRQHVLQLSEWADTPRLALSLAAPAEFLRALPPTAGFTQIYPLDVAARLSPLRDWQAASRLARLARSGTDLLHAHGLRAAWIAALARPRVPFLVTAHNLISGGRAARLALGVVAARAAKFIAVTEAVADDLSAAGVPRPQIVVVPNGVALDHFAALPSLTEARTTLDVAPHAFVVGCVARLSPEKGVDVLLQAAARQTGMKFLVAGDGPEREVLARSLPSNARLLGRIEDTRVLLAAADALVIPSHQEGQGIVALEAAAAGVPLVVSRVGGLAEMLTDGKTALLVPPNTPEAVAAALGLLRDDPDLRVRLAQNARALVQSRYDIRRTVAAVEQVYATVLAPL